MILIMKVVILVQAMTKETLWKEIDKLKKDIRLSALSMLKNKRNLKDKIRVNLDAAKDINDLDVHSKLLINIMLSIYD